MKATQPDTLTRPMLENLAESGLTPEDAKKLGMTPAFADDTGYSRNAYWIPYFDLHGKQIAFGRHRFLEFIKDDDPKYLQVKGSRPHLYLPPLGVNWAKVAADPSIPIVVTEGEKKAAAMCKLGIPCIGIGGIWNYKMKGAGLLPEWAAFTKDGRKLTVIFDSDHDIKPPIQLARRRILEALALAGADAGYADIEQDDDKKQGLDDLIVAAGDDARTAIDSLLAKRVTAYGALRIERVTNDWLHVDLPPQEHALPSLPMSELTVMNAEGGAGKSALALQMATAVATGSRWVGQDVLPGPVLYVSAEDRAKTLRRRLRWMRIAGQRRALAIAGDDRAKRVAAEKRLAGRDAMLVKHFHTACVNGGELHVVTMQNGTVVQSPGLKVLINRALTVPGLRLIILDPLSRLHGCPENGNEVMTGLANAADALAQATGAAVLVLHHVSKSAAREREISAAASRGGTGLTDGARSVLRLAPLDKQPKGLKLYTYDENAQRTEVTSADYANERVMVLAHVKANLSAKEREIYLMRDSDSPSLRKLQFDTDLDDGYTQRLEALRRFVAMRSDDFRLNKESMRLHHNELGLTRAAALTLLDDAIARKDLIRDADYEAKNPRSRAYVFRPIPANPPDTRQHNGGYQESTVEGGMAGIPANPPLPMAAGIFSAGIEDEAAPAPEDVYPPIPAKPVRRVKVLRVRRPVMGG